MSKTVVAKRTIQVPGPKFKPMKIDPVTGGHLDAGVYDVKEIAPGKTIDLEDEEAEKLVERGCAEWPEEKTAPPAPPAPPAKPAPTTK